MSDTAARVRPLPGPSFAGWGHGGRRRMGGAAGARAAEVWPALATSLGGRAPDGVAGGVDGAAQLIPPATLVMDADACRLDGRPLAQADDWWRAIRAGALGRVEGAFVVAWRDEDGAVNLARDPIGHRSLYYAVASGTLAFASTVRALLASGLVARRIRLRAVAAFLSYAYVPGRDTIAEGIFEVLPGEQVTFPFHPRGDAPLERRRLWDLPSAPERHAPEAQLGAELRAALERAVTDLLPENGGPVAASLSGGIDSSLVVALAQRQARDPVATFAITFGAPYKDELAWSGLVAAHCRTRHTVVELAPATILAHLDDTIACLDKPNGDPLTVPNALLFRTMAAHAAVALNGEGGDPCFGGPKNVSMLLSTLYGQGGDGGEVVGAVERAYLRAHLKCYDDLPDLLDGDVLREACTPPLEDDLAPWLTDQRRPELVPRLMALNTRFKGGHHILPKVDALSAPFGILARSPLFAKSVVELAFAIPPELKLKGSEEKYLLKRSVADLLPAAILERPKSGMMVPVEGWFQDALLPEARRRILDGLAGTRLFRRSFLESLVSGTLGGLRPRRGVKIWLLVTLEAHLRALGLTA